MLFWTNKIILAEQASLPQVRLLQEGHVLGIHILRWDEKGYRHCVQVCFTGCTSDVEDSFIRSHVQFSRKKSISIFQRHERYVSTDRWDHWHDFRFEGRFPGWRKDFQVLQWRIHGCTFLSHPCDSLYIHLTSTKFYFFEAEISTEYLSNISYRLGTAVSETIS